MDNIKIAEILMNTKNIAIVGLSSNEDKPSYMVAKYLQNNGYKIIPVNPKETEILGETCYKSLTEIDGKIDMVNIFRRSEHIPAIVDEAIHVASDKGIKVIWMQLGLINEEAASKARQAGLKVIMDKCTKIEHQQNNK